MRIVGALLAAVAGIAGLHAADIDGNVVIKRKLTRRAVTPTASSYQRGIAVELGADRSDDPLAFERTRVAIFLEGQFPCSPIIATLEQKNRRFVPDTLIVPAGSTVSFPNLDHIFHNVFSLSKPKAFDLGNYPKDHTRTVTFEKPGVVFVHCHLHPNMAAAIVVTPNQWSARPDAAGRFTIEGVPAGSYTIVAWHKAAGYFRKSIRVAENRAGNVEFVIPIDEAGVSNALARR
jgi:plastocyanin